MDRAKRTSDTYSNLEAIKQLLEKGDYQEWDLIEFGYCLRVLKDVSEKDFETATNFIFESLQENKERLEKEVHNL